MRALLALALALAAVGACSDSPGPAVNSLDGAAGLDGFATADTADAAETAPPAATDTVAGPLVDTAAPAVDTSSPLADTATPPADTASPPADTSGPPGGAPIGGACASDADCAGGDDAVCLGPPTFPGGYCALANCQTETHPCPSGASCWGFGAGNPNLCIQDCASDGECRVAEGYACDADDTCWPTGDVPGEGGAIGDACASDDDCDGADAFCYPAVVQGQATGFYQGYCMIADCTAQSCPSGSRCESIFVGGGTACVASCEATGDCHAGYGCFSPGMCWPSCATSGCDAGFACDAAEDICVAACQSVGCPTGAHCWPDGTCGAPPCTPTSCGAGTLCGQSGHCVPDLGAGPGPGPGPSCPNIPAKACTLGATGCAALLQFEPVNGPGYTNYPLNGETWQNQYRSYAREDLQRLIKWATAMVDCKAAAWAGGNGHPLGLGDMSEADGAIPGTSVGSPGHPPGTHVDGVDMDIAYYQITGANNHLRAVCPHTLGGQDAYRCVAPPNNLDVWRTAYFIGLLVSSPKTRVIGVDGQIGPLVEQAFDTLCDGGWLDSSKRPCASGWNGLAYETVPSDPPQGWYNFHHHHLHISTHTNVTAGPTLPGAHECKIPGCAPLAPHQTFSCGDHAHEAPPPSTPRPL